MIAPAAIQADLRTARFGREMRAQNLASSTNDIAREWAKDGAPHGAAVLAERQTAGRGKAGRTFFSPAESGLYMSVILRDPAVMRHVSLVTGAAAVGAARAIERLADVRVGIKWVNDLVVCEKKVAGILSEAAFTGGDLPDFVVVGIGVNVGKTAFPPELSGIAISLAEAGAAVDRNRLAAAILDEWEAVFEKIGSRAFLEESRRRSVLLGRRVTVTDGERTFAAVAKAIDENGCLTVETANGKAVTLRAGDVTIRPE